MHDLVDREYIRRHPGQVIKTFGLRAYVRAMASPKTGLLEQVAERYIDRGIPMPGRLGNAYRLSALLELRVARIYAAMGRRFTDSAPVREFFAKLQAEEEEHGRIMLLCLYTVDARGEQGYVPSVRDPEIRDLLGELRAHERNAWRLSLDEALELTDSLEASEVNVIFDRLLAQVSSPKTDFFIDQLARAEGHATVVPRRIQALRERLALGH